MQTMSKDSLQKSTTLTKLEQLNNKVRKMNNRFKCNAWYEKFRNPQNQASLKQKQYRTLCG